ncbi:MAG: 50S ribosomal protein L24 [Nanoarchaeota archaeon]|jgi:large subunit ribosomal protein L24
MKTFSPNWLSSKKPRKQRKYRANAPLHRKAAFLGAHLSKELRKKYGTRALRLRKGDKVKIMRGNFKGKTAKVEKVSIRRMVVFLTGIHNIRKDGSKNLIPFQPSNLLLTDVTEDKRRFPEENNGKTAS